MGNMMQGETKEGRACTLTNHNSFITLESKNNEVKN